MLTLAAAAALALPPGWPTWAGVQQQEQGANLVAPSTYQSGLNGFEAMEQPAMDAVDFNSADEQQAMASGLSGPPSFDPKALTGVAPGMGGVPPGMGGAFGEGMPWGAASLSADPFGGMLASKDSMHGLMAGKDPLAGLPALGAGGMMMGSYLPEHAPGIDFSALSSSARDPLSLLGGAGADPLASTPERIEL